MSGERIYLFDTTLRDGAQTQGVDFSVADKVAIARELDLLGIDYIEGGWPGANPTDDALLRRAAGAQDTRKLTAFGMTRRAGPQRRQRSRPGRDARQQGARRLHGRQDLGLPCRRRARRRRAPRIVAMIGEFDRARRRRASTR